MASPRCTFTLSGQPVSPLVCDGQSYAAFSGVGPDTNNPERAADKDKAPIPPGTYYTVARESGGRLVQGVMRGRFRLHPIGPRRLSEGCITLDDASEYDKLRHYLLSSPPAFVPGTNVRRPDDQCTTVWCNRSVHAPCNL